MAMTESEFEAHLENIPVETQNNSESIPNKSDQNTDGIISSNISQTAALSEPINTTTVAANIQDVSPKFDSKETPTMEQEAVPSTSQPEKDSMELELQNEGQDEGFKGFDSLDDIDIDAEQMLQIVNVISLCEHDDIINANQSQLDDIINADQSELEDIITDQCQLDDIIKQEPLFDDSITENQCMEVQQDLQCVNLLNEISTFGQQPNDGKENQSNDVPSNLDQSRQLEDLPVSHVEHNVTQELQLFCQQGDSVTEDQRLMVAEANLRYGIPTVEYEVDHEESPVVEQPYLCTECRQRFSEHDDLEQHLWDHIAAMTGKHPHRCSKCPGRTFSDMKEHKRHHRMGLECDVCGEAFHAAIVLADHRIRAHTRSKIYPCKLCKMTFTTRAELSKHKERHSKNKLFSCKMCNETFQSEIGLSVHMKTHSGSSKIRNIVREKDLTSDPSASKSHLCAQCRQDFISFEKLQNHVRSEHPTAPESNLFCDVCQKSFLKLEDLKMHKATHSNHRLYKNEECETSFAQKKVMKEHTQKHRDDRKCQVCGYISSSSSRLVKHMKKNHRDKFFECKRCSKWFTSKEELSIHILKEHKSVHKKEKSNSSDLSKSEGKDCKTLPTKEILEEDPYCESPTTEMSLEDHERSSSPEDIPSEEKQSSPTKEILKGDKSADHHDSLSSKQDKLLEPLSGKASLLIECQDKVGTPDGDHSLEPLKKKLKEDTSSSSLESSTDVSTEHSNIQLRDDENKISEASKIRSIEDQKSKPSDNSKERSKGGQKSDIESSKDKSRHKKQESTESSKEKSGGSKKSESSKERSKHDDKSSGGKVQIKAFKIPKLKKSKEINTNPESSEQSQERSVEDKGPISYGDSKEKSGDDKRPRWVEPMQEDKKVLSQESTKSSLNKIPLLATPPINKLPLLPTPVSAKQPLLATPNNLPRPVKKSRWGEPLKEDTATVWSGPSRVQSVETNTFKTNDSTERPVEDKNSSWYDSLNNKARQFKKSRWGEPPKEDEAILSSTSVEKSMEENRLKANPLLTGMSIAENKLTTNSLSPAQLTDNSKFRSNQTLPPPVGNANASNLNTVSSGRISEDIRFKSNPASTIRPTEDNRLKLNSMPTGRPMEDSRSKSNPTTTIRPSDDNRLKPIAVSTGRPVEDSRFKSNSAPTTRPTENNRLKSNSVPTGRPAEDSRSKSNPVPTTRPTENNKLISNSVLTGRPVEDSRFKLNSAPTTRPPEDNRLKLIPGPIKRPIEDTRFISNAAPFGRLLEENRLKSNSASTEDVSLKTPFFPTRTSVEDSSLNSIQFSREMQLEYDNFEMMVKSSIEKAVVAPKPTVFDSPKDKPREDKKTRWSEPSKSGVVGNSVSTSYKPLMNPVSKYKKSVEDESLQEDNRSIYSGSPMDIGNDDSSSDKSVEVINVVQEKGKRDQEDEGLIWGASFLEENKLVWGKSFLEDQNSMLHDSLKQKAVEQKKPLVNRSSKNLSTPDLRSDRGKTSKEGEASCSKSLKNKSDSQTKSQKISVDYAHNSSKESSLEDAQPALVDPLKMRPVEDPSLYYTSPQVQEMQSLWYNGPQEKTPETNTNSIWLSSSSNRPGMVPLYHSEWGESSTSESNNTMLYGEQHFQAGSKPVMPELPGKNVKESPNLNSYLAPERNTKGLLGSQSSQPEGESEENKGSNLSELLEEWMKGHNKPDEPVISEKLENPEVFVPSRRMVTNSDEMKWGEPIHREPAIEPLEERSVEDRKSNLSDLLEEWLKEHKK